MGSLETEKDFERCRKMIDDSARQTTETKTILSRILEHQNQAQNVAESNNRRMMYTKLKDNLGITVHVLEDITSRFKAKDRNNFSGICGGCLPLTLLVLRTNNPCCPKFLRPSSRKISARR